MNNQRSAKTREGVLAELLVELDHTRRGRTVRRRAGAALAVVALVTGAVVVSLVSVPSGQPGTTSPVAQLTQTVTTDPGVLARYECSSSGGSTLASVVETKDVSLARIEMLSDRSLVDVLAAIGRPAGIVRSVDRVWLTQAVTDDERAREERG